MGLLLYTIYGRGAAARGQQMHNRERFSQHN